jgi:hypothetical protein
MIIIYGHRAFGRVDAHGGEHVQTSFAHIYYMPLFPTSSFWVTQDLGNAARGFTINWSGKSIVAAYLRSWGPIAAIAAIAGGGAVGVILALAFVGLTGWAWSLRSLRGATALRRSDFNVLAFGTRCDPARLERDTRASMKTMLDQRWTELGATRPPDDVAKYGATSVAEAAVAYGLLRLAAIERRPGAAEAADRIFNGTHEPLPVGDGPYRGDDHAPAPGLLEQVASRAAAVRPAPVPRGPWWTMKRKAVLAGVLGLAALGGVLQESPSLLGVRTLTAHDLAYARTGEEIVSVRCDSLEPVGDFENNPGYACMVGDKMLPVVGKVDLDVEAPGAVVSGRIHAIRASDTEWPDELRYSDQVFQAYLRVTSPRQSQVAAIICIVVLALVGGFAVRWTYGWWKSRGKAKPNV